MSTAVEHRDALRASFERFAATQGDAEPVWLRQRRTAGFARFVEKGLPGPRDEAWRHTPVAPLVRARLEPARPGAQPDAATLALLPATDSASVTIAFVNGRFSRELSRTPPGLPVEVLSLAALLRSRPEMAEPWFDRLLGRQATAYSDLNSAFAEDGAVIRIAPGARVEAPIHVVQLAAPEGEAALAYLRTLVLAGRGSEATLVETFAGPAGREYLVNAVSELVLEEGARLDHYKLQREGDRGLHVATLAVRLEREASFHDHALSLGAALSRNDIDLRFGGEGGECVLNGLFVVDGERVADTHSRVEHAQPRCTSRQLYKGILDGQARGVFHGLVRVAPGAQQTDAEQTNRNLLLSRGALVHSNPQLEILADDVKCKHGSTTGQLDEEALFYLRSRGIGAAEARGLLTWAFASELLAGIRVAAVREAAERQLRSQLRRTAAPELAR